MPRAPTDETVAFPGLMACAPGFGVFRVQHGLVVVLTGTPDPASLSLSLATVPLRGDERALRFVVVDASSVSRDALVVGRVLLQQLLTRLQLTARLEICRVPAGADYTDTASVVPTSREVRFVATDDHAAELAGSSPGRIVQALRLARDGAAFGHVLSAEAGAAFDLTVSDFGPQESDAAIVVTDVGDGTGTGVRVLYVNDRFEHLTGFPKADVLGGSILIIFGAASDMSEVARCRQAVMGGRPCTTEFVNYRKDGTEVILRWTVRPLVDAMGRVVRFQCYLRDTTEIRRYESLARASNLASSLATMVASVRHELGNPVNSIKAAVTYLRKRHASLPHEKVARYYTDILGEVARTEQLLETFRSFSAYERPSLRSLRLGEFFAELEMLARASYSESGCSLVFEGDAAVTVDADPRALRQVLLNLLSNASAAFNGDTARRIRVIFWESGGETTIIVADDGVGIPQDIQEKLFTPFLTTKPGGTGLGLVICKRLVEQMKGRIKVESVPLEGTRVVISLASGRAAEE